METITLTTALALITILTIYKLWSNRIRKPGLVENYRIVKGKLIPRLYAKLYLGKNGPVVNGTEQERLFRKFKRKLMFRLKIKGFSRSELKRIDKVSTIVMEELDLYKNKIQGKRCSIQ